MSLSVGDRLGRYEILGPLGAGGMGEVWRARDSELERMVAVKILPESVAADPDRLARFQREARALAALSHPNLLDIYDVGSGSGLHYAVTELLSGDTLRQKIPTSGLPWQKVAEIGAAVADGLAAAHARGIIHRDVKPENLYVTADGRVKILDFGLARVVEDVDHTAETASLTPTETEAGTVMGTPGYMAPEQVKGQPADARSDIFALGCVLYEMVSGHRAFGGDSSMEVMAAILKEEPPQLSSTGAKVPLDLERTIHRCLEKRPEARFQSAADLAYSLKHLGSSQPVPVMTTPPATSATLLAKGRRPRLWLAAAAVVIVVAAAVAWQTLRPHVGPSTSTATVALTPNRIAVVSFVNRTGDPSLDGLAVRTADRLTQGLAELAELEVVPASAVSAAAAGVDPATLVHEVARSTHARLVLSGVWDDVAGGLELQATIEDAGQDAVVHAFEPIAASRERPGVAIATLRDRALMAVQDHLHPALAFGAGARLPTYEAYQEYRRWFESLGVRPSERWRRALEIDPDFLRARLGPALVHALISDTEGAEAIFSPLEGDPRLTARQEHIVRGLRLHLESRWETALQEFEWVLDHGDDDYLTRVALMFYALRANRPAEVIEHFDRLGPPPFDIMVHWLPYSLAADAYHRLGRYQEELELARRWRNELPGETNAILTEGRALIGLGRLDELERLVELAMTARQGVIGGGFMLHCAGWLRAHGFRDEAIVMADRGVEWWTTTNLAEQGTEPCDVCVGECLLWADRYQEALAVFAEHADTKPGSAWQAAVAAAFLGDRATVDRFETLAEQLGELGGKPWFATETRAWIAAALGDRNEALQILREAIAGGYWDYLTLQLDFTMLQDDPEFEELIRPRG